MSEENPKYTPKTFLYFKNENRLEELSVPFFADQFIYSRPPSGRNS